MFDLRWKQMNKCDLNFLDSKVRLFIKNKLHTDWEVVNITDDEGTRVFPRIQEYTAATYCLVMCCSPFIVEWRFLCTRYAHLAYYKNYIKLETMQWITKAHKITGNFEIKKNQKCFYLIFMKIDIATSLAGLSKRGFNYGLKLGLIRGG